MPCDQDVFLRNKQTRKRKSSIEFSFLESLNLTLDFILRFSYLLISLSQKTCAFSKISRRFHKETSNVKSKQSIHPNEASACKSSTNGPSAPQRSTSEPKFARIDLYTSREFRGHLAIFRMTHSKRSPKCRSPHKRSGFSRGGISSPKPHHSVTSALAFPRSSDQHVTAAHVTDRERSPSFSVEHVSRSSIKTLNYSSPQMQLRSLPKKKKNLGRRVFFITGSWWRTGNKSRCNCRRNL